MFDYANRARLSDVVAAWGVVIVSFHPPDSLQSVCSPLSQGSKDDILLSSLCCGPILQLPVAQWRLTTSNANYDITSRSSVEVSRFRAKLAQESLWHHFGFLSVRGVPSGQKIVASTDAI